MKITRFGFLGALLLFSCADEDTQGICNGTNENGDIVSCIANATESDCERANQENREDLNWTFMVADICAPTSPFGN